MTRLVDNSKLLINVKHALLLKYAMGLDFLGHCAISACLLSTTFFLNKKVELALLNVDVRGSSAFAFINVQEEVRKSGKRR